MTAEIAPGLYESYFHREIRVLIAGDALGSWGHGRLRLPMAIYTEDAARAACSIRKLTALEPEIICFGHGPVMRDAAEPLRQSAAALADCPRHFGADTHK